MKKTRNLFVLAGLPPDTVFVLDKLCFKGMVTFANGSTVTEAAIEKAFSNNKSVVCSKDDYLGKLPESAIIVNVTNHILSQSEKILQLFFLITKMLQNNLKKSQMI